MYVYICNYNYTLYTRGYIFVYIIKYMYLYNAMLGTVGTLTEFMVVWNKAVVSLLAGHTPPFVVMMKEPWKKAINELG